jgi:catecholate siderophore receptor
MLRSFVAAVALIGLPLQLVAQVTAEPQDSTPRDTTPQMLPTIEVQGATTAPYLQRSSRTATKTDTPLRDVPQAITVITKDVMADQRMQNMADVVRYVPGVTMGQGEGNRDQPTIRGNSTTAGFFVDGSRDDVQYFRDLYNVERVEALKGANALIFGRGVGGGVLNRVTKTADWTPTRELMLQGGSYGNRRTALDVGEGVSDRVALRFNGVYENSDIYRDQVGIERYGLNPTATLRFGSSTRLLASYEHFKDQRTADRGVPSFAGSPFDSGNPRTFFGDPEQSESHALVNIGTATIEHTAGSGLMLRNRSVFADYDKFYQNVFPGSAVNDAGTEVNLSAYNNATNRQNLLNETEVTYPLTLGSVRQTLLGGVSLGSQVSDNLRHTGFFTDTATTLAVPVADPTVTVPVRYLHTPTDGSNHVAATSVSVYGQTQMVLARQWQAILGARYEHFDTRLDNHNTGDRLSRVDNMVSPRAGLLFKPVEVVSFYGSYSVSALPASGDQFASLSPTNETLEPERFTNYELGAKWDVIDGLSVAGAAYRLDRTNTSAPDPADPTHLVQTGSQRTQGFEVSVTGTVTSAWQVIGGYTNQKATVTSTTARAPEGARVPMVPRNSVSLWNRYQVTHSLGFGLGLLYQDEMFAAIDDAVTLPSFARVDAAAYYNVSRRLRLQANLENLFDEGYFPTADSNNNITPGSPRAVRVTVVTGF